MVNDASASNAVVIRELDQVMILKQREDRAASIATLEALMTRPEARRHDIERLRTEIDAIIRGDMSESKAAYVLDVEFGASRN